MLVLSPTPSSDRTHPSNAFVDEDHAQPRRTGFDSRPRNADISVAVRVRFDDGHELRGGVELVADPGNVSTDGPEVDIGPRGPREKLSHSRPRGSWRQA